MSKGKSEIIVRNTQERDFDGIIEMTTQVYSGSLPWSARQLSSHIRVFPEGQFVAVEADTERIVGMAASLIIRFDDYEHHENWRSFTDSGLFTNHDPENGRTLYGAEVMVRPRMQSLGIGSKLYSARRKLVKKLGLLRIRAGARLRNYHKYHDQMSAEDYVIRVLAGKLRDPTLSFQIRQGFRVLAVIPDYLKNDPESLGYAALIEWINKKVAKPEDYVVSSFQ